MKYKKVIHGEFISRPNRFIAYVKIDGTEEVVHVKNTGRCKELLIPGVSVYLEESDNPLRKTKYDLIAVRKEKENDSCLINMDSQIPNFVVSEWLPNSGLFSSDAVIRREVTFASSRFDLYVEDGDRRAFIEVKGVTLEKDGIALFPDAPTERGVKHIRELIQAKSEGFEAYILFVIQMKKVHAFCPNTLMHPQFAKALVEAERSGVRVLAMDCVVTRDSIRIDTEIPVNL